MSDKFAGKVILITGAANGIGKGAAMTFAAAGAIVVATDLQADTSEALINGINQAGGTGHFIAHDVSSEDAWISVIDEIKSKFGRLDVVINNAGIGFTGLVTDMELSVWQRMMAVNVDGVFLGVKHSLPLMRDTGGGSIINVSSVAGIKATANFSGYCATKAAVKSFTKSAALESAAAQDGVRINSIHPGIIDTAIWDTLIGTTEDGSNEVPRAATLGGMTDEGVPFGRPGTIQEIVNGMVWLASDESSYMTGAELVLDGGFTAG